jgi:hypothetical protein
MAIDRGKLWRALAYDPHPGQLQIHDALDREEVRRVVGLFGRRGGKSHAASKEAIYQALRVGDRFGPPHVYIVSDTYGHSKRVFQRVLLDLTTKLRPLVKRVSIADLRAELVNGGVIEAKSADNPSSLAGDGLTFAVIDEAGFVKDYAVEVLEPALSERKGKVLAIGTPDNRNWYWRWYQSALQERDGFRAFHAPSTINPFFPPEELERARQDHPQRIVDKYYGAVFVDDEGAVFAGSTIEAVTTLRAPEAPVAGRAYVFGLDLAKSTDFNVLTIADATERPARLVHHRRWNNTTWDRTVDIAVTDLERYGAVGYVDATGVGDPVFEAISKRYRKARAFKFTGSSKPPLVEALALMLEREELLLYFDPVIDSELRTLRGTQTANGVRYAAPEGLHDDVPMSLALLAHNIARPRVARTSQGTLT